MNKIRVGDEVMLMVGRDKGARGTVKRAVMDAFGKVERVVVEGANMVTHHDRPNPQKNLPGGLIKREASVHVSNVAVVDKESGLPIRVKIVNGEKGRERSFQPRRKGKQE